VALAPLEIGEYVGVGPPRRAELGPLVVIELVAADINHRIDRARPAQASPARLVADPAAEPRLRHRLISIVRCLGNEGHEPRRLHPDQVVRPTRLNEAHAPRSVPGKPARRRTPRAAAA